MSYTEVLGDGAIGRLHTVRPIFLPKDMRQHPQRR
jgi:hypothetical protein